MIMTKSRGVFRRVSRSVVPATKWSFRIKWGPRYHRDVKLWVSMVLVMISMISGGVLAGKMGSQVPWRRRTVGLYGTCQMILGRSREALKQGTCVTLFFGFGGSDAFLDKYPAAAHKDPPQPMGRGVIAGTVKWVPKSGNAAVVQGGARPF